MISASLAVKIFDHPVQSLEDILDSEHNLLIAGGNSIHRMFLNADTNSVYGKIRDSGKLIIKSSGIEAYDSLLKGKKAG